MQADERYIPSPDLENRPQSYHVLFVQLFEVSLAESEPATGNNNYSRVPDCHPMTRSEAWKKITM